MNRCKKLLISVLLTICCISICNAQLLNDPSNTTNSTNKPIIILEDPSAGYKFNKINILDSNIVLEASNVQTWGGRMLLLSTSKGSTSLQIKENEVAVTGSASNLSSSTKLHILDNNKLTFGPWGEDYQYIYGDKTKNLLVFGMKSIDSIKGTDQFFMSDKGLGIGCIPQNPAYKLTVNGVITCKGMKVQAPKDVNWWPDFVFDHNYKLKPLNEVESYIFKNKHLPDVPSCEDIKENGIDLNEMFKIQMKKIEELTLYMIQLQKENEILRLKLDSIISK